MLWLLISSSVDAVSSQIPKTFPDDYKVTSLQGASPILTSRSRVDKGLFVSWHSETSRKVLSKAFKFCAYFAKQWPPSVILNSWSITSKDSTHTSRDTPWANPATKTGTTRCGCCVRDPEDSPQPPFASGSAAHNAIIKLMRQGLAPGASSISGTAVIGSPSLVAPTSFIIAAAAAPATPLPLVAIVTLSMVPSLGAQQDVDTETIFFLSKRYFALVSCTQNTCPVARCRPVIAWGLAEVEAGIWLEAVWIPASIYVVEDAVDMGENVGSDIDQADLLNPEETLEGPAAILQELQQQQEEGCKYA
ncbi:hypothetical protein BDK51DRAFT_37379 [Blyttiomyces helicus]|uniref:Uncharacterized protein n=1 Tax=Blyttiomyces helicus TaxID=388810 RepID=A0A4P9WGZ0_9FUNG|nr:hypothetical protein BDK51DRAFT_37379 [Blyttiomyces helicus]|eukprot:RKO91984.1 hypothetical protein BDK51DRAFT_37379 [Blyttiomyces helicus]